MKKGNLSPAALVLFALVLLMAYGAPANAQTEIHSGETLAGTVTGPAYLQDWVFKGSAGERIIISAVTTSGDLDTRIVLYPPDSGPAEADSTVCPPYYCYGGDWMDHQLQQSGVYTIIIRDYDLNSAGSYNMTLIKLPGMVSWLGHPDGGLIAPGQALSGQMNVPSDLDVFQFYGDLNDRVLISAATTSGSLDTRILLYAPGSGPIEVDSAICPPYYCYGGDLMDHQLLQSGLYTIIIRDYDLNDTGSYNLSLTKIPSTVRPGIYNSAPANGTELCSPDPVTLQWDAVATATGYGVYFGTDVLVPLDLVGNNIAANSLAVGELASDSIYCWRVVAHTPTGDIQGPYLWFSTCEQPCATSWNRTFGGTAFDGAWDVQLTNDDGYVMAGYTSSSGAGGNDAWLIKTDANGNRMWEKTFGGANNDSARSVQQTSDGGYILAGFTTSYGAGGEDVWLIKTDANGNKEWDKIFGGTGDDEARSVRQTSDGGYIIAGFTRSYGGGSEDVWLIKTDANGNLVWDKKGGATGSDGAWSVRETNDHGYIVAGWTTSYGAGGADFWLVRTDTNGNKLWDKTFGGAADDGALGVQQTTDLGYIISGFTNSYGAGGEDFWLIKTDANGNKVWDKTFGGTGAFEEAVSIHQTSDGGYITAGHTSSYGAGGLDAWVIKTDANGNKLWDRTFGGTADDGAALGVLQDGDGAYVTAGFTYSFGAGDKDAWLIKILPCSQLTTYYRDDDQDGYGLDGDIRELPSPESPYTATQGGDCDDGDALVNPGAQEITCNGVDDDCDGVIDEGGTGITWLDDFESYTTGAFPSPPWANSGNTVAHVDDMRSVSGSKSLKLFGALGSCWSALAHGHLSIEPPYFIELYVYNGSEQLLGCHPCYGSVSLNVGPSWTTPERRLLAFVRQGTGEKSIIAGWLYSPGNFNLGAFASETWYKVGIKYEIVDASTVRISYWINDVSKGSYDFPSFGHEAELAYLTLQSGEGSAWFDDMWLGPAPDGCAGVKGDINNDGNINSGDAILALRTAAGLCIGNPCHPADDCERRRGDVNCDGLNNSGDAILILREAAGLNPTICAMDC